MNLTIGRFPSSKIGYLVILVVSLWVTPRVIGDTNTSDTPSYYPAPDMQVHSDVRQPEATGLSVGIYGGVIAFQDGTLHITSPDAPGYQIDGNTQSKLGGVAGIRIEDTWQSFAAIGGDPAQAKPSVVMPAMGVDLFWAGYRYKATDDTFGSGSSLTADINTFTFMYTPKLKFDLGAWRPYVGFGVVMTLIFPQKHWLAVKYLSILIGR
jgi:hypothetical protein